MQILDDFEDGPAAAAPRIVDDLDAPPVAAAPQIVDDLDDAEQPGMLARFGQGVAAGAGGLLSAVANPYAAVQGAAAQPRESAALAARIGLPMVGAVLGSAIPGAGTAAGAGLGGAIGGVVGGALGGGAGEYAAQRIEGRPETNLPEVAIGAAGGAFMPGRVAGGVLRTAATRGAQGAAFGVGDQAARAYVRGEPITAESLGAAAGVGGLLGAAMGVPEGYARGRAPVVLDDLDAPPPPVIVDDLDAPAGGARPGSQRVFPDTPPAETYPSQPVRSDPVVPEQQPLAAEAASAAPAAQPSTLSPQSPAGRQVTAFGPSGSRYEFRYRVADLDELGVNNPDVQPRDRTRFTSEQQIADLARRMDPEQLLAGGDTLDRGAPIVGPDLLVESGNGRVSALRRIAEEDPGRFDAEVARTMRGRAAEYGLTADDFAGKRRPIIVRERLTDIPDRKAFAAEANQRAGLDMAASEQARVDADRLPESAINAFEVGDSQSVEQALQSPRNRTTVASFLGSFPAGERAALVTGDGTQLTPLGAQRMKAALLARTYEGEAGRRLVDALTESADTGIKNIEAGIFGSLGKMAQAKQLVASGARPALDVTDDVARAAQVLARLRAEGQTVRDFLAQGTLGGRDLTPFQEQLLEAFDQYGRSGKRVQTFLRGMAQEVIDAPEPGQSSFLGMQAAATKEALVAKGRQAAEGGATLFDALRNERGAVEPPRTLAKLFGVGDEPKPAADAPAPPPERAARQVPAKGSLLNQLYNRGRDAGSAKPPADAQGVLLYGPDDRPLVLKGPLSAHDPDKLAPSFRKSTAADVDERLADMQQRLAEFRRDRVAYARRHVVPVRQTYREADALRAQIDAYAERNGLTPRQVVAMLRRRGEGVNAAGLEVLNGFNVEASTTTRAAAARAVVEPTAANRQAAREALALLLETQPQRAGGLAEAGRTLNIARYPRGPEGNVLRAMRALERDAGGAEKVDEMIDLLARMDPNDTVGINRFVRQATTATLRDKLYELWINALLSGPVTQVKNAVSNALNQPIRIAERGITGAVDPLRAALTGTARERFVGEAVADLIGTAQGVGDGVRAGLRAFLTEIPSEGAAKFLDPGTHRQAIGGRTGRLVRLPSRTLLAFDEFFKAMTFRGEMHAQAFRRAAQEGHTGAARRDRMAEILATPDEDMIEAASTAARYWAFQQKLGQGGQAVINLRAKVPGLSVVIPFVQTPVNVAKFGLERTPLSLGYIAAKAARGELRGGELSEQTARMLVGSAIAGSIAAAAVQGLITGGGPRDPNERRAWLQTHQPYSVKVGDTWVSYGSLEPLGMTVGLVADSAQVWDLVDQEDAAHKAAVTIATSLGYNLGNKTFLRGVSDMMSAYMDPDRYGERWVQSLAGTLVPTGAAQLARAADPTQRRPGSLGDVFKSRVPGLRDEVLPVRDIWGEPLREQGLFDGTGQLAEFAERALSPIDIRRPAADPASREVARLGAAPQAPARTLELAREKIALSPEQWDAYVRDSGRAAKERVTRLVTAPGYRTLDDEQKRDAITQAFADARAQVRAGLKRDLFATMRAGASR